MQKIAVIEDDKNINEIITEYLKDTGFEVLSFQNGQEAKNLIDNCVPVDLFILDIMLPNVTGLSLLETIRGKACYLDSPVIMLTAIQDEYTQLLSFEQMADDYVTKPFSPKVLVKRVQAILRRNEKEDTAPAGIVINTDNYQAYEDGVPAKLTLREFELLKIFFQNINVVFTRQQLLDAVWGYDYFGDERVVDVHIKNLRKKFNKPVVETVKGVGYRAWTGGEQI